MSKILFFHNRNDFTGSTRVLANIIESEYAEQIITILAINDCEGALSHLHNLKIIKILFPRYNGKKIFLFSNFVRQIHALLLTLFYGWRYDTFYLNTITPAYAAVVGRLYNKKIIYHVHEKFVVPTINVKLLEFVFNHTRAKRVFVSQYVMSQYPPKQGCISVVKYNSLSKSFLAEVVVKPIEKRLRNTVILIASLSKVKGLLVYIEVAKRMPDLFFQLVISSDIDKIKNFFNNDIPKNVILFSAQNNIHPFLASSDLIMNLTNPAFCVETFGMTILEGMVYGLPAIVPNVGGPIELIRDGYNGYCIDVTDVDKIVKTIKKVFDKDEYERLAHNSLEQSKLFINV